MRAVVIREPGGPEVLELRDLPEPDPPFGHVRVAVRFAGVNRADLLQRAGKYPAPKGAPKNVPGLEYVGTVDALGAGTSRFSRGARVYGITAGGAYAEKVVVHERETCPVPEGLGDEEAGAVPEVFLTAYDALSRARLRPGERVLVHAAGSGVGTAGVQIAKRLFSAGLVLGTSRSPEKLEKARALGLDVGIAPEGGRFAEAVLEATGGEGADVVLDLVGGPYVAESLRAAAPRARLVVVGLTGGATCDLPLGDLLRKRAEILGTVLRARPLEEKIEASKMLERELGPALSAGVLRPVVDRIFPLEQAAAAHTLIAKNEAFGKVLLRIS